MHRKQGKQGEPQAEREALDPVRDKPQSLDGFQPPVAWLLGSQLLGALKQILLHLIYSERLDHRDWMRGTILDRDGRSSIENGEPVYWFDYIADTGDSQAATYSIAYLCLSDLYIQGKDVSFKSAQHTTKLPRGDFLFVGGDTAYPVADLPTLQRRFREPFQWASTDVQKRTGQASEQRPLVGIPGNHDHYDALDGFNRQFKAPPMGEGLTPSSAPSSDPPDGKPMLAIDAFYRAQEASYVAIRLPFDWWLLGLDTQGKDLDFRQIQFFKSILKPAKRDAGESKDGPTKLIVATPNPTTAFGLRASDELACPFEQLELKPHFRRAADQAPLELAADECRLDISGNWHHYERYWGEPRKSPRKPIKGYASVVAGGGSAFLHPPHVRLGSVQSECCYPEPEESRNMIADRLFDPRNVYRGGFVGALGLLVSFLICMVTFEPGQRSLLKLLRHALPSTSDGWRSAASLVPSLCGFAALFIAGVLLWRAGRLMRRRIDRHERWPRSGYGWAEFRSFLPSFLLVGLAFCVPGVVMEAVPGANALDIVALFVALALGTGLVAGACVQGGAGRRWPWKAGFGLLGLWHAVLQLGTGTFLVRSLSWPSLGAILVAIVALTLLGWRLARSASRAVPPSLLCLWLLLCAIVGGSVYCWRDSALSSVYPQLGNPWVLASLAGALGIVFTGLWLGWYLAVSIAFNGHDNEAGIVARVETHKHMIRFRLTKNEIKGYVITLEKFAVEGTKLKPQVIDVFRVGVAAGGRG